MEQVGAEDGQRYRVAILGTAAELRDPGATGTA